jgi:hypothetical protein
MVSETRQLYIGTESSHNVHTAELVTIKLAADIVQTANRTDIVQTATRTYKKCVIYTHSQPAIKATAKTCQQSGQSILASVIDAFEVLQHPCIGTIHDSDPICRIEEAGTRMRPDASRAKFQ